jgi:hypothetical protein
MVGQQLSRLTLQGRGVANQETLVQPMGRIRDVRQGLDGDIYLVIEDREGRPTPVYRMEPVGRSERWPHATCPGTPGARVRAAYTES